MLNSTQPLLTCGQVEHATHINYVIHTIHFIDENQEVCLLCLSTVPYCTQKTPIKT